MENKTFKCLSKSCGVSYNDKLLGPCPVCGSDNTKLETKKWPLFLLLSSIVGIAIFVFFFFQNEDSDTVAKSLSTQVLICDTSKLDLFDVGCDCEKQTVLVNITGYEEDSCGKLQYSVNGSEISYINSIKLDNMKADSIFNITIYNDNNAEIKSLEWPNNCYVPKIECNIKESLISEFQESFKLFLKNPSNATNIKKLKSLAKKIGFINKNIATTFDNELNNMKLINLMNRVSKSRQFQDEKTKLIGEFEIKIENSASCIVNEVNVELKSF